MSVDASKKKKAKVEFITNGQNLLIDIGNWVDSQKDVGKTTGLDHFFNLASQAYICMSFANSVRIVDVDTYASRLDNFRKAKSYYRALREYLTVIGAMYQIKKSRKKDWNNCLYFVDIEIDGVIKSDLKVFQKAVGKFNKTANILNKMLDEYNNKQLKKMAAKNKWRREQVLKSIENGEITEPTSFNNHNNNTTKDEINNDNNNNLTDS